MKIARGQRRSLEVSLKLSAERRRERTLGWTFLSTAAAFGLGGLVLGLLENSTYGQARDLWMLETSRPSLFRPSPELPEAEVRTRSELDDLRARGERYAVYSNLSFGVAAAALGVTIYFFIRERPTNPTNDDEVGATERPRSPLPVVLVPLSHPDGSGWVLSRTVTF